MARNPVPLAKGQATQFARPAQMKQFAPTKIAVAKVPVVQAPRENNFRHFSPLAPPKTK